MAYDVIVVGGGSAGCVAAGRLAGEFGARVLLLEAGLSDHHPFIRMPAGIVRLMAPGNPHFTRHLSVPQRPLGGRAVAVLQANALGGGSSLNVMTYTRGSRADYDAWDAGLGGAGWSWQDMLPHFIRQEANQRLGAPAHGVAGKLRVSDPHHPISAVSRAFLLALQQQGLPYSADVNAGVTAGATVVQSTTFRGQRWSAARAYLAPLKGNPKLTVALGARATRIVVEQGRAVGVEYAAGPARRKVVARAGQVILAAGCFVSAQLLMLSGIGPAAALRDHGIAPVVDLPGVGQGMQDHNDARLVMTTRGNHGYAGQDRGWRALRNGLQYVLSGTGPVASTGSEVTAFLNPTDAAGAPTIQLYCMGRITRTPEQPRPPVGVTLVANLIAPRSRGSVRLRSADPFDLPLIDPNWLSDPHDLPHLVAGLRFLLRTIRTAPLAAMAGTLIGLDAAATDDDLAAYCRATTGTNWHPVGSCRMGRADDPQAVVDAALRVRGVAGLRVFDGSVMPAIIGGNTNAPIMAIADRGVDLMMGVAPPAPAQWPSSTTT